MIKYSKFFNVWLLLVGMSLVSACTTEDNAVEPQQEDPAAMFDHTAFKIPDNEKGDMDYVINAGYKAYVYGGTVRDAVVGVASNDVDFTTDATPEELETIVPNTKIFVAPNGYKVAQAWHGDERTDMTTMRAIYYYLRGKEGIPESSYPTDGTINVYSKELWEDSYSRDLTINADPRLSADEGLWYARPLLPDAEGYAEYHCLR